MEMIKKSFLVMVVGILLIGMCGTVSAEDITDEKNDIYCYTMNMQTQQYTLSSQNVGDKGHIDIVSGSYEVNGNTLTMSMTVDEKIPSNSLTSICTYILYYGDPDNVQNGWHTATYTGLYNAYQTIEGGTPNSGELTGDLISADGKTFTASFDITTTDPSFEFWATAMEVVIDMENMDPENPQFETKTYVDVAPFGPGEWAGSTFMGAGGVAGGSTSNDDDDDGDGSPGFEMLAVIAAIGVALIILRRRK